MIGAATTEVSKRRRGRTTTDEIQGEKVENQSCTTKVDPKRCRSKLQAELGQDGLRRMSKTFLCSLGGGRRHHGSDQNGVEEEKRPGTKLSSEGSGRNCGTKGLGQSCGEVDELAEKKAE